MTWKKGQTGNPNGAPPGPRNRTESKRAAIEKIVDAVLRDPKSIDEVVNMPDVAKKWDIICKLLPYYVPRLESESVVPVVEIGSGTLELIKEKLKEKGAA